MVWIVQKRKQKQKERKREQTGRQNFLSLVTWWGVAIKFSWKIDGCFFCQQKEDMMEWPIDKICNVTEIKIIETIQSILVERSWNQWFLPKRIFYIMRFRKKKIFLENWPQSQATRITKLTERKVGSVKYHGGLWRLTNWLKSLTNFAHNILRKL